MWVCIDNTATAAKWLSLFQRVANAFVLAPQTAVGSGSDGRALQLDTGGNARGANAVDLQRIRGTAGQVASGTYSFIAGGKDNTASGNESHAEGLGTTASGLTSHAEGMETTASGSTSHAEGYITTAYGSAAHAEGRYSVANLAAHAEGNFATASGVYSHAEGTNTSASGIGSHAEGAYTVASSNGAHAEGWDTTASADASHAEGQYSTASGIYSHAGGNWSHAHLRAQWARAAGGHSAELGTAQSTITQLFVRTVDATANVPLTLDGSTTLSSSNTFTILAGQTLSCLINVVARKESGGTNDNASFFRQVLICRGSSTPQIVGSVQLVGAGDINPDGWGLSITADSTHNALQIAVTGAASTNIRWTATISASEAADAAS